MIAHAQEGGLDWLQQACATIRETALAQEGYWATLHDQPQARSAAEKAFEKLLDTLEKLTTQTDFVVLWDLENTLRILAAANFDWTVARMEQWAREGSGLQPMFATQVLSRLSAMRPDTIAGILLKLSELERYRTDFWLARMLIYGTLEVSKARHQSEKPLSDERQQSLQRMVQDFASTPDNPYIRGVALAALPFLAGTDSEALAWIDQRVEQETWPWAFWNMAFELQNWPYVREDPGQWLPQMLSRLAKMEDPHVRYAIDKTAAVLVAQGQQQLNSVRDLVRGNRWLSDPTPGRLDFSKVNQIGIV
jgi:hypothetical protein